MTRDTADYRTGISVDELALYEQDGYFVRQNFIPAPLLAQLRERIDDWMMGQIRRPGMFFQLDTTSGAHRDLDFSNTIFQGPSRNYRKIKGFEYDPLFLALFQDQAIRSFATRLIGPQVSSMRAMLLNKPPHGGTYLPFHQDVSRLWRMSAPPTLTLWLALDDATVGSGCLEVVAGSHKNGAIGDGHILSEANETHHAPADQRRLIELKAGGMLLFHCALLHRSGFNSTGNPRRAMTLCLMDGAIIHTGSGKRYPMLFGPDALTPQQVDALPEIPQLF